ncbi:30S ribosomal protein S9, partial [Candidatus Microgenomates bacterium]|nr:30S ribosomal protein S9 [Candidatus Microgenomates bacterium]MBI2622197.1 30S ribosomal protein S9 [Candidatus Microgenomates bacterium]
METNLKVKNQKAKEFIHAVGRRREAVARVRLYSKGSGIITVNAKPVEEYFAGSVNKIFYLKPFTVTDTVGKFDITVKVEGGGLSGQLGAMVHGIARALSSLNKEKYRSLLKKQGLLTRDPRTRQRRMVGTGGKARRK